MSSRRIFLIATLMVISAGILWRASRGQASAAAPPPETVDTLDRPAAVAARDAASPRPKAASPANNSDDRDDEAGAMARIRDVVRTAPNEALARITAADEAYAYGPFAEERAALRVDGLVNAGRIGMARDVAEVFLRDYPESTYADHIRSLTGVHLRPLGPHER